MKTHPQHDRILKDFSTAWGGKQDIAVNLCEYANGGTCIQLLYYDKEMEGWFPHAKASSWIAGLGADEIAIKDYSENEGMLEELIRHGVITSPHRCCQGFPVVKLVNIEAAHMS